MKKMLTLLLALALLSVTAACGKSNTAPTTELSTEKPSDGTTPPAATQPATEPAVDSETGYFVLTEASVTTYRDGEATTETTCFTYDDSCNLISHETADDGVISRKETYDLRLDTTVFMAFFHDGQIHSEHYYQYDEQGRLLSKTSIDSEQAETVYEYDQHGSTLSCRHYIDGELDYEYTYENSYDGQTLTKAVQYQDGAICREVHYDSSGHMTERISYEDGTATYRVTWRYDDRGNVLEDAEYYQDKKIHSSSYTYDDQGNLIGDIHYCGPLESRETFEYEDGRLAASISYSDGEESSRTLYEYDADGNITKITVLSDGEEYSRRTFRYDGGRLVERRSYHSGELSTVTAYEYDRHGSLIRHEQKDAEGNLVQTGTYGYEAVADPPENAQALEQYLSEFLPFEQDL